MILYHGSNVIVNDPKIIVIVEGPMADDTVWNYVNDFLSGRINRKQFWALAEFRYPTHQISFHTLSALDCLTFIKSEVIYDSERKK